MMTGMRALSWSVLASFAVACGPGGSASPAPPLTVLVTLDTTRADRLGAYGYEDARTPVLDRIASEGALFLDASATAPTTLPSHASILTGLFPPSHGARNNGNHLLPPEIETLAEVFQRAGYATGAFVAAEVLSARYGLDQGFDHYDDDFLNDATAFGEGYRERSADTIVDRALAWLGDHRDQPAFCWLHVFDPHYPYQPAPGHAHPYDAEIARVDTALGRLVAALRESGRYGSAVLAVVADHGEGLGDKGEDTHGLFVYQATIRVPLLLRAPGRIPGGTVVDEPVSTVDLAPSVLSLAGLAPPPTMEGRALFPPSGSRGTSRIYFETLLPRYEYMWSNLAGMREGPRKFISAPTPELYSLDEDPGEEANLLAGDGAPWNERFAALVGAMAPPPGSSSLAMDDATRDKLAALGYGFTPIVVDDERALPDPKDQLERHHLYRDLQEAVRKEDWQGVLALTDEGLQPQGFDPYQALFAARALTRLEEPARAEALYHRLLVSFPEDPAILRGLASVQFAAGELPAARATYERLVELDPLHPQHHAGLGDCWMALGDADAARLAWEAALQADPYFLKAWNNLGILDAHSGRHDSARRRFEHILTLDPTHEQARANLRRLAQDAGRPR